jgi:hypothetical protein
LEYLLRIVPRGNELVLIGTSRTGKAPEIIVGSTQGLAAGFMKIILKPGWQFTKRTFNNKVLGHFYFSGKQADVLTPSNTPPQVPTTVPSVAPESFPTTVPSVAPESFPSPAAPMVPSPTPLPNPVVDPTPSMPVMPTPTPSVKPSSLTPSSTGKPKTGQTKPATINNFRTP